MMYFSIISVATLAAILPAAFGHYNFNRFIANGVTTQDYEYIRRMTHSNSPVTSVASTDMRCNYGTQANAASTKTYPVTAGSTVGFTVADSIGHGGPLFAYMSKAPGPVSSYDGSGSWFKIYELGIKNFADDKRAAAWAADGLRKVEFKLPRAIPDGEYLLRLEHIALHGAQTVGGAQAYVSCAQIKVSGGSGGNPGPMVKIPGLYDPNHPGLHFNPYYPPLKNYTMPGPKVYVG
ncbi:hypothetical protein BT63DRAFT_469849 [Microthyrium microscopicum]|uniref:lytic cellulose monooxygenase (C4-dehydrogenating) n=1 Tax=Microthyrium microscopicum TaxID=703497 RepID=A0A6A6UF61_9PEZI|nr:hypothetical protein BT63DRAFT_469849 [Microthyrium microscopicum]